MAGAGQDKGVEVRLSTLPMAGRGVFTMRPFTKGEVVCHYAGEVLTKAAAVRCVDQTKASKRRWSHMRSVAGFVIDGLREPLAHMGLGSFANDARDPERTNARYRNRDVPLGVDIVATRDIGKGEEVFVSYGKRYWDKGHVKPGITCQRPQAQLRQRALQLLRAQQRLREGQLRARRAGPLLLPLAGPGSSPLPR